MVNQHTILGNVGKDPELRTTERGNVATFSVATTETWKDSAGTKQEQTTWHNVVVWGTLADIAAKWLKKGNKVYLVGKVSNRTYEKDGITHHRTETVLSGPSAVLKLLTPPDNAPQPTTPAQQQQKPQPAPIQTALSDDDDLPF